MNSFFNHVMITLIIVLSKSFFLVMYVEKMGMDEYTLKKIKNVLRTKTLKPTGNRASGCINDGETYQTDNGFVFIKKNDHKLVIIGSTEVKFGLDIISYLENLGNTNGFSFIAILRKMLKYHSLSHYLINYKAQIMFESEFASLQAIEQTNTIRVPHPIAVVEGSKTTFYCILEHVDIHSLRKYSADLGEKLAKLHLHNEHIAKSNSSLSYIEKFGFSRTTCVGLLPVNNTWIEDWPTFYSNRLDEQVKRLGPKEVKANEIWHSLKPLIPKFFENIDVRPSLLHGDLWSGNVGETTEEAIIFDPGSVYGHHEFDLAMTTMFGRLPSAFYDAYHELIPRDKGFRKRESLYHLFHALNHWNHFGSGYKQQSLDLMKNLIATKFPLTD